MARFQTKRTYDCIGKLLRWNRRCLLLKTNTKNISQSVDGHLDVAESETYCPFLNQSKTLDKKALSSLLLSPLSIHCANKVQRYGERIYLDKFHSVTSILSQTKPASEHFALKNWKKAQISELGKEQFEKNTKNTFKRGTQFHHSVQLYFKSKEVPFIEKGARDSGYWQSVSHVLKDITNVVAVESAVVHPLLGYAGTLDLIAEYEGALSVIDWKTSAKHKTNLKDCYSYPQQIVAYAGAVNFDENYPFQVCNGVIVIAYENGDPADVHHLSQELCEKYWQEWLTRLQQYRSKFPERAITEDEQKVKETGQEMYESHRFEKATDSLQAKSVNSIGVPVTRLGTVIKDEDVLEGEEEDLSSKERFYNLHAWLAAVKSPKAWKKLWKNILQRIRFRGKDK
ncbi:hypothetical protein ACROYT_G020632 [Oculina patagonica]